MYTKEKINQVVQDLCTLLYGFSVSILKISQIFFSLYYFIETESYYPCCFDKSYQIIIYYIVNSFHNNALTDIPLP